MADADDEGEAEDYLNERKSFEAESAGCPRWYLVPGTSDRLGG